MKISCSAVVLLVYTCLCVGSSTSDAAVIYTSQDRSVSVQGFVNNVSQGQIISAPDFLPFNRSITRMLTENAGSMFVLQNTSLLTDRVIADCRASITIAGFDVNSAVSSSTMDVTFQLTTGTNFLVQHTESSVGGQGSRRAEARLSGPGGVVFDWAVDRNLPSTWPAGDFTGFLPAGTYSLHVAAATSTASAGGLQTISSSVNFTMIIPSPAGVGVVFTFVIPALLVRRRRVFASTRSNLQ